jgi:hypothetical protein
MVPKKSPTDFPFAGREIVWENDTSPKILTLSQRVGVSTIATSSCLMILIFQHQVIAFLMDVNVNGNATHDGTTILTSTVKTSFSIKSRAVLHVASLDRSKFLP